MADFNNDNKLDIITAHRAGANIRILLGNGNGGFQPARYHSTGTGPVGITTADLNFDGNMDIINTCYNENKMTILLGNGNGSFQQAIYYNIGNRPEGFEDSLPDIIVASQGSNIVSISSPAIFAPAVSYPVRREPVSLSVVDVNGDGNPDALTANIDNNSVSVLATAIGLLSSGASKTRYNNSKLGCTHNFYII
ncbi:MAG: VCBS repeat-containing protein [Candidatus Midichloria sp.]|nr:VCBS repeat-containing protein [Candidatus Midichloria sp.]